MKTTLRPHQDLALDMIRESFRARRHRPVLQLPTGSGKTLLAAQLMENALTKGKWKRIIFTVPRVDLIEQTKRAFKREGLDVGLIWGSAQQADVDPDLPVQIASLQTLQNREIDADAMIIDEVHLQFKWLNEWMSSHEMPMIGLSATPWAKGMGLFWNDLLKPISASELIKLELLSPFEVYAPDKKPELSSVKKMAGDYNEKQLSEVMQDKTLVADAVTEWHKRGEPEKTILFAVDRAHARKLQTEFQQGGYRAGYIDAYTAIEDRKKIHADFRNGEIQVLTSVDVLSTGSDMDVRCIISCRPTHSRIRHVQSIGRGLRTAEGKDKLIIIDHSTTHLKLGFVTQIDRDELHSGKPAEKDADGPREAKLPKPCPACGVLMTPGFGCLACGLPPPRASEIEHVNGELSRMLEGERRGVGKAPQLSTHDKAGLFAELKCFAQAQGYAQGWAAHKFKEATGVWPNHYKDVRPRQPSSGTLAWIRSQRVAWAKSKRRQERGGF